RSARSMTCWLSRSPSRATCSPVARRPSALMSQIARWQPLLASSCASARPMPLPAPLRTMVFPLSCINSPLLPSQRLRHGRNGRMVGCSAAVALQQPQNGFDQLRRARIVQLVAQPGCEQQPCTGNRLGGRQAATGMHHAVTRAVDDQGLAADAAELLGAVAGTEDGADLPADAAGVGVVAVARPGFFHVAPPVLIDARHLRIA